MRSKRFHVPLLMSLALLLILVTLGAVGVFRKKHSPASRPPIASSPVANSNPTPPPLPSLKNGAENSAQVAQQRAPQAAPQATSMKAIESPSHSASKPRALDAAEPDACYTVSYKHKELSTHPSEDECSHHRNLIKLPRNPRSLDSICVRVNGKAVPYEEVEGSTDEIVIGPVAGPRDTITAHFCVGVAKCPESCDYPKKEVAMRDSFMDAIGGSPDKGEEGDPTNGTWQEGDSQKGEQLAKALDPDMRKELENSPVSARKPASRAAQRLQALEIFKDWLNEGEKTSCVRHGSSAKNTEKIPRFSVSSNQPIRSDSK